MSSLFIQRLAGSLLLPGDSYSKVGGIRGSSSGGGGSDDQLARLLLSLFQASWQLEQGQRKREKEGERERKTKKPTGKLLE